MPKTWRDLTEELKYVAEIVLEKAKEAFQEGQIETALKMLSEFRKTVKTAGELNLIASSGSALLEEEVEEDIQKALGLTDEEDLEIEEMEEIEKEKIESEEEEEEEEEEKESEEEPEEIEEELEENKESLIEIETQKIKQEAGEPMITLDEILRGVLRKRK